MWIKNLRQRKLQTLLIFLIITICTTLLTGAMSILIALEKPSYDFAKACNAATVKIYPFTDDKDKIYEMGNQFLELTNVKSVEYLKYHYISETMQLNGKKVEIFADLTEYNENVFGSSLYLEGDSSVSKNLAANECILPVCISNEFDIHIGDTVSIILADNVVEYKVVAVYTNPYQTSTAYGSDILVTKLPDVSSKFYINVFGLDEVSGKQIEEAYRETYDGIFNATILTLDDRISNGLIVGRIIGAMFLAIGVIMLLVSGLMIYYMINNAMIADAKTIALYKTIGYTSNDILLMYLKLYFIVVTLACFVGILCSVFVSNTILTSIYENMGQLRVTNSFTVGLISYVVIISFIVTLITLIISKSKRIKPIHSLNGTDYGGIKKKRYYKGNSTLQFSALGIAYRTFVREKRNALSIIVTCVVTIFSINFIVISMDIAGSMKQNNDYWLGIDKADVMVTVTDSKNFAFVKDLIEKDPRTDYYLSSNLEKRITMKWKKGMSSTTMYAFVYNNYELSDLPVTEGRNPKSGNEIAISTSIAEDLDKSIGDYLEVYLDADVKADLLITGLFQTYMNLGSMCRLTTSAYTDSTMDFAYNNISVYLKNNQDIESYIRDVKILIGGKGNVIKRTEQFVSIMNMIITPQQKALPPVAALIILIAGVNIFSIVYLKNIRAQMMNGIYKCIGYTTWHLICSNLCYVTIIAFVSVVITFPLSLITYSPIMALSLSRFNFTKYPMQINTAHLVIANMTVIIIFILSTLISSKSLFKVSARDLIQE